MAASKPECNIPQLLPTHLVNGDEVYGRLGGIEPIDSETIADTIGKRRVLLPAGLELPTAGYVIVAHLDKKYVAWGSEAVNCFNRVRAKQVLDRLAFLEASSGLDLYSEEWRALKAEAYYLLRAAIEEAGA